MRLDGNKLVIGNKVMLELEEIVENGVTTLHMVVPQGVIMPLDMDDDTYTYQIIIKHKPFKMVKGGKR